MEIRNNFNNQNFKGIKLSSDKFEDAKFVANVLQKKGFDPLGHTTVYANNNIEDKIDKIQSVRDTVQLQDREFAAVYLPWSAETYIIGTPNYEQKMLPIIQKVDPDAQINMAI